MSSIEKRVAEKVEHKKGGKSKKKIKSEESCDFENEVDVYKTQKIKKKRKKHLPEATNGIDTKMNFKQKKHKVKKKALTETVNAVEENQTKLSTRVSKPNSIDAEMDSDLVASDIKLEPLELQDEELDIKEHIIKDDVNNLRDETDETAQTNETIDWPEKDLTELIKRMEAALPEKDNLVYSTRAEKLNWDAVAFQEYTGESCKKTWMLIQKRVRRFRLLSEVLQDAKEWISKPWTNFYRGNKTKRHPDMPRRPLSSYMLFYLKKKDKIVAENPGIEMTELSKRIAILYKNISQTKREKYMQLAVEERRSYEEKLDDFYRLHPEISRFVEKPNHNKPIELGPKKPLTPFALYFEEQLRIMPVETEVDRHAFKEQCKEQWRNMSDKKKVIWIDWALDKEAKYQDELKNYISKNPEFVPITLKNLLTKEEKSLKERLAGKPIKPPNSAYSLFSRMKLQSVEIKKIASKDRMKTIADQWKTCTDEEKKQYREHANHLMEQYKLDFASYLESLPEEKRQEELQNNLPKRKLKTTENEDIPLPKKRKSSGSRANSSITRSSPTTSTSFNENSTTITTATTTTATVTSTDTITDVKTTITETATITLNSNSLAIDNTSLTNGQESSAGPKKSKSAKNASTKNATTKNATTKNLSTKNLPTKNLSTKNLPTKNSSSKNSPAKNESTKNASIKSEFIKNEEDNLAKIFESEPPQPPVSGFALFSKRYHGKVPLETAWKNLSKIDKKEYEAEVQKLKQKYIKEYEKFLKTLSKEQLTAFSQLKRK